MILWLSLFLLIIGISFILAFRSMKDYQEIPQKIHIDYGLFLIRQIKNFDAKLLDAIRQEAHAQGAVVSLERLFKGHQTTLTVFSSRSILSKFQDELNLLELEDYAMEFIDDNVSVWEMGVRKNAKLKPDDFNNIFSNLPQLEEQEQFFWQVVLDKGPVQIRAAVLSPDPIRKKMLSSVQNLNIGGLVKIPKPFSNEQMIESYKSRSFSKETAGPVLDSGGIIRLVKV